MWKVDLCWPAFPDKGTLHETEMPRVHLGEERSIRWAAKNIFRSEGGLT